MLTISLSSSDLFSQSVRQGYETITQRSLIGSNASTRFLNAIFSPVGNFEFLSDWSRKSLRKACRFEKFIKEDVTHYHAPRVRRHLISEIIRVSRLSRLNCIHCLTENKRKIWDFFLWPPFFSCHRVLRVSKRFLLKWIVGSFHPL